MKSVLIAAKFEGECGGLVGLFSLLLHTFEKAHKKKLLASVSPDSDVCYSYCFYFLNTVEVFVVQDD